MKKNTLMVPILIFVLLILLVGKNCWKKEENFINIGAKTLALRAQKLNFGAKTLALRAQSLNVGTKSPVLEACTAENL